MSTAREDVLTRLRRARDVGTGDVGTGSGVVVPRDYRNRGAEAPGSAAVLARLADTIADYRAAVHRVTSAAEVPGVLARILDAAGAVVVPPGLPTPWVAAVPGARRDDPPLSVAELDRVDAVVTGAAVAVAETGTFVLAARAADQGRRAITLVPDRHVCVIDAAAVVATVPEALARLDPAGPLTFVSGPSATSDIELDRVEGVHGPRRLDVVLVGPAG